MLDHVSYRRKPGYDFTDDIRRLLRTRLAQDGCSAGGVAGLPEMSRRTLNRRLCAEGTRFRTVVNEIRFEIARQLLADTSLSFAQIAAVLDYSEASAFTRAFRRWSGQTPTSLAGRTSPRARLSAGPGPNCQNIVPTDQAPRFPRSRVIVQAR